MQHVVSRSERRAKWRAAELLPKADPKLRQVETEGNKNPQVGPQKWEQSGNKTPKGGPEKQRSGKFHFNVRPEKQQSGTKVEQNGRKNPKAGPEDPWTRPRVGTQSWPWKVYILPIYTIPIMSFLIQDCK